MTAHLAPEANSVRNSAEASATSPPAEEPCLETRFEEMKRYVAFTAADARLLAAFHPHAAPHFARIAQAFYDRIREHEQAHDVFTGEEQIARLQRSLERWMGRLLSGVYDDAYYAESEKIGRMHVKVGLPQRYMFTAMALIRVELTNIAERALGAGEASTPTRDALTRLLDLELAIMLESYREDFVARVQRVERQEKDELSRALVRAEHRYVNAVELARMIVIGLDAEARVRLFNREAERVSGYERDEAQGMPFSALLQEDRAESVGGEIERAARGEPGVREVVECALRTKSGRYRDVRWQVAYAQSPAGDDVALFVLGHDTTEELALKEKTLQHEKLAAVGTLAAGLAHEIRNPLNGALLHVSFLERALRKRGAEPETLEAVTVVGDEIKRLASLVSEFLDFARPRPPQPAPTSARALSDRAIHLLGEKARGAGVEVTLDFPSRDPMLDVDPAKIEQVLLNLLANAIEASRPGEGGRVTLRVRRVPRDVVFEVEDDGVGLPSPEAPIFDPFYSTKPNGTGLGLAISHRIVTDHGGDLTAESKPGKTVFRVTLPVRVE
jgi:PAS domain S-box-containing protein